jgi:hypothetical protein
MTYAAYLRIYEPVVAFDEPDRSRCAAYAVSSARPRRCDSLMAEHAALCGDQSVAEVGADIDGAARGERELAVTMFMRAHRRWRAFAEFGLAN